MFLEKGARLGPYEILSPLGTGGMGEVYKARDTRLDRVVAVKVLLERHAEDRAMLERFEREARAISTLAHPSICTLHDMGEHEGTHYLVMEYLEGETLAARLARGPLPLDEVLELGAAIAGALAAAHGSGVVHRDFKPGNIMLTKAGPKLLDFGLAKLHAASQGLVDLGAQETTSGPLTEQGAILGTLQYMAPEQLLGLEADARSDIFALGCVLYEMVTGRRAFAGESQASVIGAILHQEPVPLASLQPLTPPGLERLVRACLVKDRDARWHSAADLARELTWIRETPTTEGAEAPASRSGLVRWAPWALAAAAIVAAATVLIGFVSRSTPERPDDFLFSVAPPGRLAFGVGSAPTQRNYALSPDGRTLVMVAGNASGRNVLWVRSLQALSTRALTDTEGASSPFWSPDGQWIGFFSGGKLEKIQAAGGAPVTLCDASGFSLSGTWGSRGQILFAQVVDTDISRVSAAGGTPIPVVKAAGDREEWSLCWPKFLPDGRHFLYVGRSDRARGSYVAIGDSETGTTAPLLSDSSFAEYAAGGYVVSVREGTLLAQPFDAHALRLTGEARPVVPDVLHHAFTGLGSFSVSRGGVLAWQDAPGLARLVWFDRHGRVLGTVGTPGNYEELRLSPDGKQMALSQTDSRTGTKGLWIADVTTGLLRRFSFGGGDDQSPAWSPDGRTLAYTSASMRFAPRLREAALDGGAPVDLSAVRFPQLFVDWSQDGRFLCYSEVHGETRGDIWVLDLTGQQKTRPLFATEFDENQPQFSPDGRWVAFTSDESGSYEVYLAPFSGAGERARISNSGGSRPRWRSDGRELFYVSGDGSLMVVAMRLGPKAEAGPPQSLFAPDPAGWRDYDVVADGTRFLFIVNATESRSGLINVTTNWLTPPPGK